MKTNAPRLGFCPIGKFVFSHEDALRHKDDLGAFLLREGVGFVGIEDVVPDGIVRSELHIEPVVAHFEKAGVEALILPHCNFGTEDAAARIAKKLDVPTLLWGPRDEAPLADGTRLRDTLCGLLATSKVVGKLGVPFSYIPNCRISDPAFSAGLHNFLGAAHAANIFRRGCRIGMIGQRIDFFWSTISNESELLQKFNVEVVPLDMVAFLAAVHERARTGYAEEVASLRSECIIEGMTDQALAGVLAVRDEALALAERYQLDAMTCQTFMSLPESIGAWPVFADSLIGDRLPFVLESDLCGALSNLLLARASLGATPFLVDVTARHPDNESGVLLWHAGAPLSLKHPEAKVRLGPHWILPGPLSGMTHFPLRDGPITCARFDGDHGNYELAVGEGHTCDGPTTLNNYVWMEVRNWPRWERGLIDGPFMHHIGMAFASCGDALREAVKFIPNLVLRDLDTPRDIT